MTNKPFLFYLRRFNIITSQYQYYFVDNAGVVQLSNTKRAINYAPEGWQDQELKWERGFTYHGVFTHYTTPFKFTKDGRKILKSLYYNNGVNAICELLVEKFTNIVSTWNYQQYFLGDIDFSRFQDEKDFTQVEILQQGFMANIRSKENTKFEIPVTQAPDYWVRLDGYPLQGRAEWGTGADTTAQTNAGGQYWPVLAFTILEGYNPFMAFYTQSAVSSATNFVNLVVNNSNGASVDIDFVFDYYVNSFINSSGANSQFGIDLMLYNQAGVPTISNLYLHPTAQLVNTSQTYIGQLNFSVTVPSGYLVAIRYMMWVTPFTANLGGSAWEATDVVTGSSLIATWALKVPETYVPCITQINLGTQLVDKIQTGETFNSDAAVNTEGYLLTSGDALRNLDNAVIKTTFKDFFASMNSMHNIGMRYDTAGLGCVFDQKRVLYDETFIAINLGQVETLKIIPLVEVIPSGFKFGYKNYDYDTINGKEEFNIGYEWVTSINRVENTVDLTSPYRADMYGVELTRANLIGRKEADAETDNDVFWIHADLSAPAGTIPAGYQGAGQVYYDLYRDNTLTINNLAYPSDAFNIDFSPKRRMIVFGDYIKSILYNIQSSNITYASSTKTQDSGLALETDDGVTIISEKANEQISGLSTITLFNAVAAEIEVKTPIDIKSLFDATIPSTPIPAIHAILEFEYKGNTYSGFCMMVSEQPTWRPKQKFKLILSNLNNLTDLINGL